MSHWLSQAIVIRLFGNIGQLAPSRVSQFQRTSIHILSDDSLLRIIYHCRPALLDQDGANDGRTLEEKEWDRESWWYKLAHVCRKWRYLVLTSASNLDLCLVCTYGTPVADMLAHSPPLPLIIDYFDQAHEVTVEDEERILFALQQRHRIRRIRIWIPASSLRKLVVAMSGNFPMLECLYIKPLTNDDEGLVLPQTFRAPQLRHVALRNVIHLPGMHRFPPPTPPLQSAERITQGVLPRPRLRTSINILDDNSLLNIFYHSRPVLLDEDETDDSHILQGGEWARERWWYKLAHICRRWRNLLLGSSSHLGLCLVCTRGTPVADMLAHSPPLPLIIDHIDEDHDIAEEDEDGIVLALQRRDRVRRIRLVMPVLHLQKLIVAMGEEFPMLDYLYMGPQTKHDTSLVLPKSFRAPHLRHLVLINFTFPTGSPLRTSAVDLVTLSLQNIHPSTNFCPRYLLQWLQHTPQLETLQIDLHSPVSNRDAERQLMHMPGITHVTLSNLNWFSFKGASASLEALLSRMAVPLLEKLQISFFNQLTLSLPSLQQFMGTAENLTFNNAIFTFHNEMVYINVYPSVGATKYALYMEVGGRHLDWQVASAVQLVNSFETVFSMVSSLTLEYERDFISLEWHNEADSTQWRGLLRPFRNADTLTVHNSLVRQLSQSLLLDGEPPLELLPKLNELVCPGGRGDYDMFMPFVDARQAAGRLVRLPMAENLHDILVDGFIAHTFSPPDAHHFFTLLLRTPDFLRHYHISYAQGVWHIIRNLQPPSVGVSSQDFLQPLDFSVKLTQGTVVPQRRWTPTDDLDIRRHVEAVMLQLPIFFVNRNGGVGFWLQDILQGRDRDLSNRDSKAPLGGRTTTQIRIDWPGYGYWKRQVPTRDQTFGRNPITLGRFMKHVGISVDKFFNQCMEIGRTDTRWGIGPRGITQRHVKIIGVVNISVGSWMPLIQLTGYVL